MKNIHKNLESLKIKIAADKDYDYLNVYTDADNIVIMLNWEKFIVKKSKVNGIKFKYSEEGIANMFGIIFNGNILEVPIYITALEAHKLEIKFKKTL